MTEIFLSYAREDLNKAKMLAVALEQQGWCVFWDRSSILTGQSFDEVIEQAIKEAQFMIVGWSSASRRSDWVQGEANIGRKRRILLPVLFEKVELPIAFQNLHTEDFSDWKGDVKSTAFQALCRALQHRFELSNPKANKISEKLSKLTETSSVKPTFKIGKLTLGILATSVLVVGLIAITGNPFIHKTSVANRIVDKDDGVIITSNPKAPYENPINLPEMFHIPAKKFSMGSADGEKKINYNENQKPKAHITPPPKLSLEPTSVDLTVVKTDLSEQYPITLPEMVRIPAGEFLMGSVEGEKNHYNENPKHKVNIAEFYLGKYEITKEQFRTFANRRDYQASGCFLWEQPKWRSDEKWRLDINKNWEQPGFPQTDNDPVSCISYDDAKEYIEWLNHETKGQYRLPTEAEWEYSARANTVSDYYWGQAKPEFYAWYLDNSRVKTQPVGLKIPNAFGLYDMIGNVKEWTEDCWHDNYVAAQTDGSIYREKNNGNCNIHVLRGGSWSDGLDDLRSASRFGGTPGDRFGTIGFRLAQDLP